MVGVSTFSADTKSFRLQQRTEESVRPTRRCRTLSTFRTSEFRVPCRTFSVLTSLDVLVHDTLRPFTGMVTLFVQSAAFLLVSQPHIAFHTAALVDSLRVPDVKSSCTSMRTFVPF